MCSPLMAAQEEMSICVTITFRSLKVWMPMIEPKGIGEKRACAREGDRERERSVLQEILSMENIRGCIGVYVGM